MSKRQLGALLLAGLLLSACSRPQPPALQWERVSPVPTDADLNALASARGLTMAVGEGGTILTSTDGQDWTLRPTETTADILAVTAAPTGFVAAGEGVILTSNDGHAWRPATGAAGKRFRAAACGPQTCVAVGEAGAVLTGKLGSKWSVTPVGTTADLLSIAYGNGKFLAVGARGAAFTSVDGRTWAPLALPLPEQPQGFCNNLTGVILAEDVWVINGAGFGSFVLTSRDGETWERRESTSDFTRLIAAGGGRILRLAFREKEGGRSILSQDRGATWQVTANHLSWSPPMNALLWDGGQFLLAGHDGIVMASPGGVAWERRLPRGQRQYWWGVAFGAGRFVAVGNGDVATSSDGRTWETQPRPPEPLYLRSIAWGADRFVATGIGVYTSADGLTWTETPLLVRETVNVFFAGDRFIAMGSETVLVSTDGRQWTPAGLQPARHGINGMAFGNGRIVAVGDVGSIIATK